VSWYFIRDEGRGIIIIYEGMIKRHIYARVIYDLLNKWVWAMI